MYCTILVVPYGLYVLYRTVLTKLCVLYRAVPYCAVSYCTGLHSSRLCSVGCAVQYVRDVGEVSAVLSLACTVMRCVEVVLQLIDLD